MQNKFVNRKIEIEFLEEMYKNVSKSAQLLILYGKRRVGKTELIKKFIEDKESVYFLASKSQAQDQLGTFVEIMSKHLGKPFLNKNTFTSWRDFFDYLVDTLSTRVKPLVIIVDEFPYLVDSDKSVPSYFQYGWDEGLKNCPIMLVVMGSSIAMMVKHTLQHSSPMFGRRTGQWLLEPFSFADFKLFFDEQKPFEYIFSLYAITGGIPAYILQMNLHKSLKENIQENILQKGKYLSVEPELLISDEFDEPRTYLTILKSIGIGQTKLGEILNATGLPVSSIPAYIKNLILLRLVKKEIPVTEKLPEKSKKGIYSISDNFLRFYFSFIFPNLSLVESGNFQALFEQNKHILNQLLAKAYEEVTLELIRNIIKDEILPHFNELGRWWDKSVEIDLVGLNEQSNSILFVETKWNSKPINTEVFYHLKESAKKLNWGKENRKEYFALVAKGGFSQELKRLAKEQNILLIEGDEILKQF